MQTKILVLGAGAVGLCVAAKLSRVCNVHAVCRKVTADAIAAYGFHMTGIWGEETYRFSAGEDVPPGNGSITYSSPPSQRIRTRSAGSSRT